VSPAPRFRPKALSRESVEAPLEPHWRLMGPEEEKRLHRLAVAEHRRFRPFGPRWRGRMVHYGLGTAAGFAIAGFLLVSASPHVAATFAAVGLLLGAGVAILRPLDFLCGTLYGIAGFAATAASGLHLLLAVLAGGAAFGIGIAIGRGEEFKRVDGED
jgi:hypothetical protein